MKPFIKMLNQNESIQYLDCFDLNEIIINVTKINLNEIKSEFNYHLRWIKMNKKDTNCKLINFK